MIAIDIERCDGCGLCVNVCAVGAIYLVAGKAAVDDALCHDFRQKMVTDTVACVAACPEEAIVLSEVVEAPDRGMRPVPAVQPEPQVLSVSTAPASLSVRAKVLPAVGAAIAWAGREIMPKLADYLLQHLDRRVTNGRAAPSGLSKGSASKDGGQGRRRWRRRRGS